MSVYVSDSTKQPGARSGEVEDEGQPGQANRFVSTHFSQLDPW